MGIGSARANRSATLKGVTQIRHRKGNWARYEARRRREEAGTEVLEGRGEKRKKREEERSKESEEAFRTLISDSCFSLLDDVEAVEAEFFRNLRLVSDSSVAQSQFSVEDLELTFR